MKRMLTRTAVAAAVSIAPVLLPFPIAAAQAEENATSLAALKTENARLREELVALRERDRLTAEISTVRSRVERKERSAATAPPEAVRAAYAAAPTSMPYKALPSPAPVATWTGVYVGLAAGFRVDENETKTSSVIGFAAGFPNFPIAGFPNAPMTLDSVSARVGPYVGYNWQFAPQWVVGVEGDWAWADKTKTSNGMLYPSTISPDLFALTGSPDTFSVKTTWDASLRARLGYLATPSVLLYAAGGPAWIHVESTSACGNAGAGRICFGQGVAGPPGPFFTQSIITDTATKLGWTLGGGVEAMIGAGWTVRADYRYSDYGTIRNTDVRRFTPAAALLFGQDGFNVTYDQRIRTNTGMIGVAHKFN